MIILDTNVLSELMNPKGSKVVRQWVAAQPIMNLFTTTITQAEILYGIALLPSGKRQTELGKTVERMFNRDFAGRILSFDEKAAIAFAMIASKRRRTGSPLTITAERVFEAGR
ncbi:MAG: PIN domain-containing protein [Hormoscilla sp. SP5CHS1]|nr:PIN domain-containing protein [Hormoscilla sp. SP12CHS1]MBC6454169.1 PIN domain-containing protein [Hormoscilla sp. SP5CHS1]